MCGQQAIDWAVTCARCQHVFPATTAPVYSGPSDALREMARLKSYTEAAVIVFILYLFLFVPGLVANYLFLKDAGRMELLAGEELPGVGFLRAMWSLALAIGILIAVFVLYVIGRASLG